MTLFRLVVVDGTSLCSFLADGGAEEENESERKKSVGKMAASENESMAK
jgi:hypothetical protein